MTDPLTFHDSFPDDWFEQEYNLRAHDPDRQDKILNDWTSRSRQARDQLGGALDIRYADGKEAVDGFISALPIAAVEVNEGRGSPGYAGEDIECLLGAVGVADVERATELIARLP
ncbi:MAG: hypothetical protein AAGJ70_08800, partial [Pseudomonadota bacterium]